MQVYSGNGPLSDTKGKRRMNWLIAGVALFISTHLVSAVVPSAVSSLKAAIGPNLFRGIYSVLVLVGVTLIVIGWRSAIPVVVYAPPVWGSHLALTLMFVAVYLFGASHAKLRVLRFVRHPQLTAVLIWSVSHLLANGDIRSIILFGPLGIWAALEIPLINRREGEWQKPAPAAMKSEIIGLVVGAVVYLVLIALHPYFAGVSPIPF